MDSPMQNEILAAIDKAICSEREGNNITNKTCYCREEDYNNEMKPHCHNTSIRLRLERHDHDKK